MRLLALVTVAACSAPISSPPALKPEPEPVHAAAPQGPQLLAKLGRSGNPADRVRAVRLLDTACTKKQDMAACYELARELDSGAFVDKDSDRAIALRELACAAKVADACYMNGATYDGGYGVAADRAKALELFTRGCDLDHAASCGRLARLTRKPELYQRAFDIDLANCERRDATGCFAAEHSRKERGVAGTVPPEMWAAAVEALEEACANGDPDLCSVYASAIERGVGGAPADRKRGKELRVRACAAGNSNACALAAYAFDDGNDVAKDPARARQLRERACALGDGASCWQLGEKESDPGAALAMHRRACDFGDISGCDRALQFLAGKRDLQADHEAAAAVRARMCRLGWAEHCVELAETAAKAGDKELAREQYARACKLDDAWRGCAGELQILTQACAARDQAACTALTARVAELPVKKRDLALFACCRDPKAPPATPTAAVLVLREAIGNNDAAAIAALVHPKRGLDVRLGWHGEDGSGEDKFKVRAKSVDVKRLRGAVSFAPGSLACEAVIDEEARCSVFEGGFGASYTVGVTNGRTYVLSIDEESH